MLLFAVEGDATSCCLEAAQYLLAAQGLPLPIVQSSCRLPRAEPALENGLAGLAITLIADRDDMIALLARSDPSSAERLAKLHASRRQLLARDEMPSPTAVTRSPADGGWPRNRSVGSFNFADPGTPRRKPLQQRLCGSIDIRHVPDVNSQIGIGAGQRRRAGVLQATHIAGTEAAGNDDYG